MASELTEDPRRSSPRKHAERTRAAVLLALAPIFLVALPCLFVSLGARLDMLLGWRPWPPPPFNLLAGLPMVLVGGLLGLWSNHRLFTTGRGTPLPLMPTQELVVQPPYTRTRNPMALGAATMYLGVAALVGSVAAILLVLLCTAVLLTYIRLREERVLTARFGQAYRDYRQRTPFLVPRRWWGPGQRSGHDATPPTDRADADNLADGAPAPGSDSAESSI